MDGKHFFHTDRKQWVDTMLKEELGLSLEGPRPFPAASTTFLSFCLAGLFPLLSYFVNMIFPGLIHNPFLASIVITGCIFFLIGALKSRFVGRRWYVAGLETLFVGSIAATLAYGVGIFLKSLAF